MTGTVKARQCSLGSRDFTTKHTGWPREQRAHGSWRGSVRRKKEEEGE